MAGVKADLVDTVTDLTDNPHNLTVQQNGNTLDIYDNGNLVTSHPGNTTSQIDITGGDAAGTISLTIDFSGGQFTTPVNYDGGSGAGTHTLILVGGSFMNEVDTPSLPGSGTITLDSETINYNDLSPIIDTTTVTNFTLKDPTALDTINI